MRILHVIHDFLPRHQAGSEIYALELCRQLAARGHELHVLCAEYDPTLPHGWLTWRWFEGLPVTELVNNWTFSSFAESYQSERINRQLDHVLSAVAPDLLHIHNLLNLSLDLPALARARQIPSVATLHEFVLLCPGGGQRVQLAEQHVCLEIDPERCARCFTQSHFYSQMVFGRVSQRTPVLNLGVAARIAAVIRRRFPRLFARVGEIATAHAGGIAITAADIEARRQVVQRVFSEIDLFVAPSPALGAEFQRFGLPADKLRVSDYGFVPLPDFQPPAKSGPVSGRLRIGFVGTLVWHKGAHILIEALRALPPDSFEAFIFGNLDTFPDYVADLRSAAGDLPVHFAGGFARERVAEVYAQMDVVVVSSLWPENSPLVIHEAFLAELPVVGARMGGIVDLISDGVNGLLYEAFSPPSLAAALRRLLDEPELLPAFARALPRVKSIDEDAEEWEQTYREVASRSRRTDQ